MVFFQNVEKLPGKKEIYSAGRNKSHQLYILCIAISSLGNLTICEHSTLKKLCELFTV